MTGTIIEQPEFTAHMKCVHTRIAILLLFVSAGLFAGGIYGCDSIAFHVMPNLLNAKSQLHSASIEGIRASLGNLNNITANYRLAICIVLIIYVLLHILFVVWAVIVRMRNSAAEAESTAYASVVQLTAFVASYGVLSTLLLLSMVDYGSGMVLSSAVAENNALLMTKDAVDTERIKAMTEWITQLCRCDAAGMNAIKITFFSGALLFVEALMVIGCKYWSRTTMHGQRP